MFGYIRPLKGELKVNEYDEYKAVYCTLCKSIGEHYGSINRFFLSYDLTFYVLLSINEGFDENNKKLNRSRCVFNPLKKCNYIFEKEDIYKKAAALTVMMSYYKFLDNSDDEKGIKASVYKILKALTNKSFKKASSDFPYLALVLNEMYKAQSECEKGNLSLDPCCEPTAIMLSKVFGELSGCDKMKETVLSRLGYFLGRWIYTMDASDDLEEDLKKKNFNPLIKKFELENKEAIPKDKEDFIENECNASLNSNISMMIPACNLLNNGRYIGIINNIINLGLPQMQKEIIFLHVTKKQRKKKDKE